MSDKIVHTSDGTFDADVLQNEKAVLLDFWAEWCGPCKMIAPLLDEISDKYEDRLAIVKLNVDENPNTAQKFGIRSIPTLMLFKDGAVQAQMMGAMPKSQLEEFLDTNLCVGTWVLQIKLARSINRATRERAILTVADVVGRLRANTPMMMAISR